MGSSLAHIILLHQSLIKFIFCILQTTPMMFTLVSFSRKKTTWMLFNRKPLRLTPSVPKYNDVLFYKNDTGLECKNYIYSWLMTNMTSIDFQAFFLKSKTMTITRNNTCLSTSSTYLKRWRWLKIYPKKYLKGAVNGIHFLLCFSILKVI